MLDWIQTNIPPWVWIAIIVHGAVLGTVAYLILLERKVASWTQDRLGPNRVGPFGLLQPLADGLKFIFKEDYRPKGVDKVLFTLAPGIMIAVVIVSIAVIPWGGIKETTRTFNLSDAQLAEAGGAEAAALDKVPNGSTVVSTEAVRYEADRTARTAASTDVTVTYRYPFQIANLNIGVLFILAVLSLAVYGVVVGGWASNNKYSFLGGLRATANMISYEIPLGLSVLAVVLMFGTLDLGEIVNKQAHLWAGFWPAWNVFCHPVAFLLFLVCIHAEANRAPFDLAEAEQELVGGYHTEYSSMRFALFFLAEYAGMITTSAVCVALFFGGWHLPFITDGPDPANPALTTSLWMAILRAVIFFTKTMVIIFIFMWVRWSLPRFRFDQLMMLAWRGLIPLSLALLMVTAVVVYLWRDQPRAYLRVSGTMALALLAANVVLIVGTLIVSRILPAAPETNRRVGIPNSRFARTPLPGQPVGTPALNREAAEQLPVSPVPDLAGRVGT